MISKLKNVISPYILISIPGIYFSVFIQQRGIVWDGFYDYPIWEQIFYFYITGLHVTALWFIPMISLFYLVSPLLVKLDRNKKIYYLIFSDSVGEIRVIIKDGIINIIKQKNNTPKFKIIIENILTSSGTSET